MRGVGSIRTAMPGTARRHLVSFTSLLVVGIVLFGSSGGSSQIYILTTWDCRAWSPTSIGNPVDGDDASASDLSRHLLRTQNPKAWGYIHFCAPRHRSRGSNNYLKFNCDIICLWLTTDLVYPNIYFSTFQAHARLILITLKQLVLHPPFPLSLKTLTSINCLILI